MQTALINWTENYHYGCAAVCDVLDRAYGPFAGRYATGYPWARADWRGYHRVILNGEGMLHHNTSDARGLLTAARAAQAAGCETFLVNAVWQNMPHDFDDVLARFRAVTVREIFSQEEIARHGVSARVVPDLSLWAPAGGRYIPYGPEVLEGGYYPGRAPTGGRVCPVAAASVDISRETWPSLVARLRRARLLFTGRHHEMYAAAAARCRFLTWPGNTWKNEGLAASAGARLPEGYVGWNRVLDGAYDAEYEKIWKWLESFGPAPPPLLPEEGK